jgi:hypothetical protein
VDELVDEPPVELEVDPPLELDVEEMSIVMPLLPELLPPELPELPKNPPAKNPPMKPPPPEPPITAPDDPPELPVSIGGSGTGAPCAVTTTTWGWVVTVRVTTLRTGLRTIARRTTGFFATLWTTRLCSTRWAT